MVFIQNLFNIFQKLINNFIENLKEKGVKQTQFNFGHTFEKSFIDWCLKSKIAEKQRKN